jgi:hypothetical protein
MKSSLEVKVKDEPKLRDELTTYKRWFSGIKRFFTVKLLPPRR